MKLTALIAFVAAALGIWKLKERDSLKPCINANPDPETDPQCFFSSSYVAARALFLQAASSAGATVDSLAVTDDGLFTDVAMLPGRADRLLVHVSGTHGTEGYVGSAIQSAWLREWDAAAAAPENERPTVVIVHALNPFGMANWRRWNEDGVDLNRNCLFEAAEWEEVLGRDPNIAGYEDLNDLVNPEAPPSAFETVRMFAMAAQKIASGQFSAVKRALVAATYTRSTGLFYGGRELATSHKLLAEYLRQFKNVRQLTFLDVHSGLGPLGKDTLLTSTDKATVERIFHPPSQEHPPYDVQGMHDSAGKGGAADGYELTRGISDACYPKIFPSAEVMSVTQEFGTLPGTLVLKAMRDENMAFHHAPDEEARAPYAKAVYDAFCPSKQSFREATLRRGLIVLKQAYACMIG
mmetsp:Transcript_19885/g.39811  ORF Transcript_19885/g.39811 Transcript_19885/m.39811 type:complete len:409 (-) Transcript_19885:2220-3446(-)